MSGFGTSGGLTVRNRGRLPHWEKPGSTYFVTFRLFDSLPRGAVHAIHFERRDISGTARRMGREMSSGERKRLARLFSRRIEQLLNAGLGACYLRSAGIANVVADAIRHLDGKRYLLLAWCVMPNHVHILFQALPGHELPAIVRTLKTFTARRANEILKRDGPFWQREYYDHLVRDQNEFARIVDYIVENPVKAGLRNWPWVWVRAN